MINQLNKDWNCTNEKIDAYCTAIRKLEDKFYGIEYHHVVRADNQAADELSKLGSTRAEVPARVFIQDLVTPSIKQEQEVVNDKPPTEQIIAAVPGTSNDWRQPFIKYSPLRMSRLTTQRENTIPAAASTTFSLMGSYTERTLRASYSKNASPHKKVNKYLKRFTGAPATTM